MTECFRPLLFHVILKCIKITSIFLEDLALLVIHGICLMNALMKLCSFALGNYIRVELHFSELLFNTKWTWLWVYSRYRIILLSSVVDMACCLLVSVLFYSFYVPGLHYYLPWTEVLNCLVIDTVLFVQRIAEWLLRWILSQVPGIKFLLSLLSSEFEGSHTILFLINLSILCSLPLVRISKHQNVSPLVHYQCRAGTALLVLPMR